jgi:hypothetical protein
MSTKKTAAGKAGGKGAVEPPLPYTSVLEEAFPVWSDNFANLATKDAAGDHILYSHHLSHTNLTLVL